MYYTRGDFLCGQYIGDVSRIEEGWQGRSYTFGKRLRLHKRTALDHRVQPLIYPINVGDAAKDMQREQDANQSGAPIHPKPSRLPSF